MGDQGLHNSIWADRGSGNSSTNLSRSGDWRCPTCGFSNFQRRSTCFRCLQSKSNNSGPSEPYKGDAMQIQPSNNIQSTAQLQACGRANSFMLSHQLRDENTKRCDQGLATSRWAPRNQHGKRNLGEVWIHVAPVPASKSTLNQANPPPEHPSHVDLGLPYEVQHYILGMMQRILEEGCYEFASRWIPSELAEKNWTCSEAVELSNWKKFLPTAPIPYHSITTIPNYPLEAALADAVRVRNSAVHRHLCDNVEIRRMAQHAQELMAMFSDVSRQGKFHALQVSLNDWDSMSRADVHAARNKLEGTLREISERPMDDMDWTPNNVSLQEIKVDAVAPPAVAESYAEYMDMD